MRIYLSGPPRNTGWWAIAGEIPGTAAEDVPDREDAIARCRRYAAEEIDAFARLGAPLQVATDEEVIDWTLPYWLIPDWLVPITPALRDAAVRRMDDIAGEVDLFVDALTPEEWDRHSEADWSVRRILDHVAGGFDIGLRRLERWPLDPDTGQRAALEELVSRARSFGAGEVDQSGMNKEDGRVRWTPRKVLRAAHGLQQQTLAHYGAGGPPPDPVRGHRDVPDDDGPIEDADVRRLIEADAALREMAVRDRRARGIASWYRYYRDRLTRWPMEVRERWRVMRGAFRSRLLTLDETELALVRQYPNGQLDTVRMEIGLGLSHVREHLAQMREGRETAV